MASRASPAASSKPESSKRTAARSGIRSQEVACVCRIGAGLNRLSSDRRFVRGLKTRTIQHCAAKALSPDGILHNLLADLGAARRDQRTPLYWGGFLPIVNPGEVHRQFAFLSLHPLLPLSPRARQLYAI